MPRLMGICGLAARRRTAWLALGCLILIGAGCPKTQSPPPGPAAIDTVILELDTPSAGWTAQPVEAWATQDRMYCLFQLHPPEGMAAQVITRIQSRMRAPKSGLPKQLVVFGKTWNWSSNPDIVFPESRAAFFESLPESASLIEIGVAEP